MNKKMFASIISIILIAALILSLAALMIGCRAKTDTPDSTPGSTQESVSQTVYDPTADSTYETSGNSQTNEDPTDSDNTDIDVPITPSLNVSIGTVEGAGGKDLDDEPDNVKPSVGSGSAQTNKPTTPTQNPNKPTDPEIDVEELTYESFWALTEKQQMAVIDQFSTTDDFVKWHKYLVAQYKTEHPEIELDNSGIIDLIR